MFSPSGCRRALLHAAATCASASKRSSRCGLPVLGAERDLAFERPHRDRAHAVLGQRAGLVGADHVGRAERLDRAEALDQRAAACEQARRRRRARA